MKRKNLSRNVLALGLAMVTALSASVPTFAATDIGEADFASGGTTPTSFEATTDILGGDLIVSIPAELVLEPDATDSTATKFSKSDVVSAKGRISAVKKLSVSIADIDTNSTTEGIQVNYALADDSSVLAEGTVAFKDDTTSNGVREWSASELLTSLTTLDSRDISVEVPKENVSYIGDYSTTITYTIQLQDK